MGDKFDLGFPRVKALEERWKSVRSDLKLSGFLMEENGGGGCKVTRLRDGKFIIVLFMELYDWAKDIDEFKKIFQEVLDGFDWDTYKE